MCAAIFATGDLGSSKCPNGTSPITSETECANAAMFVRGGPGLFAGTVAEPDKPKGCYWEPQTQLGPAIDTAWLNTDAVGNAAPDAHLLCSSGAPQSHACPDEASPPLSLPCPPLSLPGPAPVLPLPCPLLSPPLSLSLFLPCLCPSSR